MSVWAVRPGRTLLASLLCLAAAGLAHADVDIEVRGVSEELRSNVLIYLSLSRYKGRDLDADTAERLHNRVEREVKEALRPFGYYEPTVQSELTERGKNDWRAVIQIEPGPPVIVSSLELRVSGPGSTDRVFERIVSRPLLRKGDTLRHKDYDQMKDDLQRTAATYGYLDARMVRNELRVDPPNHTATIALEMQTGERYRFGATTIDQSVIKESLVRRYMRYHEHDYFDLTELLRTQFALDDSQYFSTVEVLPGDPDRAQHTVPVSIRAQAAKRNRFSFGGGYGTDTGPRGTFLWDRRLVNDSGHRFSTQIQASAVSQLLQSSYSIPIFDPALEKLSLIAAVEESVPGDLHNRDISVGPSLTRVVDRWQYVLAVNATRSTTSDGNTAPQDHPRSDNLLIPSLTVASVPRGYLGEALFEQGFVGYIRGAYHGLGSSENFLQVHAQGERSFHLGGPYHLLLRGEAGVSLVGNLSDLPGSLRYFAGGDRSVRGFAFDDLSPVLPQLTCTQARPLTAADCTQAYDSHGNPILLKVGGRHVLTGTFELERDLPKNFGVAAFYDFGNAFDVFGKSPNPVYPHFIEYSVGVGFRWRLPIVTLGVDVAQPLSRPGASPRFHLNFSPKL